MILDTIQPPSIEHLGQASGVSRKAARDWFTYTNQCRKRHCAVRGVIDTVFPDGMTGRRILDWGSAVGGVAMLMQESYAAEVHAADVDPHSIQWLRSAAPGIHCTQLTPGQRLPYADGMFDCIYGISVLTHIPPDMQEFYLAELARVCREGGIVILSVRIARSEEERSEALATLKYSEALGIYYSSYPQRTQRRMEFARHGDYGRTVHTEACVQNVFGRHFRILEIRQKGIGQQDIVVMRTKPRGKTA
jgi:ubiquinone/menaquinone biosynthesis C-methylase UbiE